MKVYLDTCSLQRPLDSKTQIRIILEADAILGVLSLCEAGSLELVASEVLGFEVGRNANLARQAFALEVLSKAKTFVAINEQVEQRARQLNRAGIKPLDALHLASAEAARVDYFCTCDDRLLAKARVLCDPATKTVSPIELIEELEK
jgi:predicted nucleic acid-binding protein